MSLLQKAIQVVGDQAALADLLRIRPQNIHRWKATGSVPAKWLPALAFIVEEIGGHKA